MRPHGCQIKVPRMAVVKNLMEVEQWHLEVSGYIMSLFPAICNFHNSSKLFITAAEWGHSRRYKNRGRRKRTGWKMEEVACSRLNHHQGLPQPQPGAPGNNWARRQDWWEASWRALISWKENFGEQLPKVQTERTTTKQKRKYQHHCLDPCSVIPLLEKIGIYPL